MRDDQRGAADHEVFQRVLHGAFALRVERRGGFIEQQDGRVLEQRAGDGDTLLLAARQAGAAFAKLAGEAFWQGVEEDVGIGRLRAAARISASVASGRP